jgi:hypothetical protein
LNLFELIEKFSGKFRDKKLRPGHKGLVKGPSAWYLEQLAAHTGISSSAGSCELIEKFTNGERNHVMSRTFLTSDDLGGEN